MGPCVARLTSDHPRSRGVYTISEMQTQGKIGSSPLARGLQDPETLLVPAPVDHPRSRGVYRSVGPR